MNSRRMMRSPSTNKLTYLAIPYSHPDPEVREYRFRVANAMAAYFMQMGKLVFSPISQTHPICVQCNLPGTFDFWDEYDRAVLENSKEVIVLKLDGWEKSIGVAKEKAIARELGIPIHYVPKNFIHHIMSKPQYNGTCNRSRKEAIETA